MVSITESTPGISVLSFLGRGVRVKAMVDVAAGNAVAVAVASGTSVVVAVAGSEVGSSVSMCVAITVAGGEVGSSVRMGAVSGIDVSPVSAACSSGGAQA
jgi:hypothetical protein